MSQDEKDLQKLESEQMRSLFSSVRAADIEPSPYLRTRVLAHLTDEFKQSNQLKFWKFFSAGSFVAMAMMGFYVMNTFNPSSTAASSQQAYVIHVDFNQNDLSHVAQAEVVLPDGVKFVTKNGSIDSKKSLRLPIDIRSVGRGKLPFVVSSDSVGDKEILVRLLDENNQVVRDQVLKFKFAKKEFQKVL